MLQNGANRAQNPVQNRKNPQNTQHIVLLTLLCLLVFPMVFAGLSVVWRNWSDDVAPKTAPQPPPPPKPVDPNLPPSSWTRAAPDQSWFERAPTWLPVMEKIVASDDPHRKLRLQVGCKAAGSPISVRLTGFPGLSGQSIRFETLGFDAVFNVKPAKDGSLPKPLFVLTSMRYPGVTAVSVGGRPFTYGITFDLRQLETVLKLPAVQECSWE